MQIRLSERSLLLAKIPDITIDADKKMQCVEVLPLLYISFRCGAKNLALLQNQYKLSQLGKLIVLITRKDST